MKKCLTLLPDTYKKQQDKIKTIKRSQIRSTEPLVKLRPRTNLKSVGCYRVGQRNCAVIPHL